MIPDPLGCAQIRQRVLGIWAVDPARLTEDANHELDLVRGGYANRVVVELAADAADAALRAGGDGRLLLQLERDGDGRSVLLAANTGAPLDAAGLAGLVSLRASAKASADPDRAAETGRFGVGFAAVLTVCDEPAIAGRAGPAGAAYAVGFSPAWTADALGAGSAVEHLPVLRLPFAIPAELVDRDDLAGYDTVVRLVLRDDDALARVREQLAEVDDPLLLGLPGLSEVLIRDAIATEPVERLVSDPHRRWITVSRTGVHDEHDLADRPVGERLHRHWRVTWAVPRRHGGLSRPGDQPWPRVVHAPTPTTQRLIWPALLVADLPLDSTRREVLPGRSTERLLAVAADAYAELLGTIAADPEVGDVQVLALLPSGEVGGWLDADLRSRLWELLPQSRFLRPVVRDPERTEWLLRPVEAVALAGRYGDDPATLVALSPAAAGLVRAPEAKVETLRRAGVHVLELSEVVYQWHPASVAEWTSGCRALAGLAADPAGREALARLPIPVVADRPYELSDVASPADAVSEAHFWRGARAVLLPGPDVPGSAQAVLARLGARVAAPEVMADPEAVALLERLGAGHAHAEDLLRSSVLVDRAGNQEPDELDVTRAVLDLLSRVDLERLEAGREDLDLTWCADLVVPDADDDPCPAALLVLPGAAMDPLMSGDDLGRVHPSWADRWPEPVWQALGVAATGPVVLRMPDVDLLDPPDTLADLDDFDLWAEQAGPRTIPVVAVRDLDLVRDDSWPGFLRLLPEECLAETPTGYASYQTWWLRRRFDLDRRVDPAAANTLLRRWLPAAPSWIARLPGPIRARLAAPAESADLGEAAWLDLLEAMADAPEEPPGLAELLELWRALGDAVRQGRVTEPPGCTRFWALAPGLQARLVAAVDICVPDTPAWLQREDLGPVLVPGAGNALAVADLLDLDLASERAEGRVTSQGATTALPPALASAARLPLPSHWRRHDRLLVDDVPVGWWLDENDDCHAVDLTGLAAALAARAGRWPERFRLAALLTSDTPARLLLDDAGG